MLMNRSTLSALAAVACVAGINADAATFDATLSTDNVIQGNFEADGGIGTPVFLADNSNARRIGTGGAAAATRVNQPVFGFNLPTLTGGDPISSATFSVTLDTQAINQSNGFTFGIVVSLMGGASQGDFSGADFVEVPGPTGLGAGNVFVGSIDKDDPAVVDNGVLSFELTGDALTQFAGLYDGSGNPLQSEVFFRLSTSEFIDTVGTNNAVRYNLARSGDPLLVTRALTIETGGAPLVPGDADGDGDVDDTDLGIAISNFTGPTGSGKTLADGDTDGDGDVDDTDLGVAISGFTGPLSPAAVPEPTSLALLTLGGLLAARRRRA